MWCRLFFCTTFSFSSTLFNCSQSHQQTFLWEVEVLRVSVTRLRWTESVPYKSCKHTAQCCCCQQLHYANHSWFDHIAEGSATSLTKQMRVTTPETRMHARLSCSVSHMHSLSLPLLIQRPSPPWRVHQPQGWGDWWLQPGPGCNHRHTQTHITHLKDKQMVRKPPMAVSALQTQVTLASFQKRRLLNRSRLPQLNKKNWEKQYAGLLSSVDQETQGQITLLPLFSLGCPQQWHLSWWIIKPGFMWYFLGAMPERCAWVIVLACCQDEQVEKVQNCMSSDTTVQ